MELGVKNTKIGPLFHIHYLANQSMGIYYFWGILTFRGVKYLGYTKKQSIYLRHNIKEARISIFFFITQITY